MATSAKTWDFRVLALWAVAICGLPSPAQASFAYTPSPNAIRGTIDGITVVIDIRTRQDLAGTYVQLAMLQQVDDKTWDYVGNVPVNGKHPSVDFGNAGMIWELTVSNITVYRSPTMGDVTSGPPIAVLDERGRTMITDWLPKMNTILAGVYGAGSLKRPQALKPTAAPKPLHFTSWEKAADYVGQELKAYEIEGTRIIRKSKAP